MLGMATYSFYNEIEISECPLNFHELKGKIKKLFFLNDTQIDHSLISYIDKNNDIHYILNEDNYEEIIPIIETIIINIELLDSNKYINIANYIDEEYNVFKSGSKEEKKDIIKNNNNIKSENEIKCNLCGCDKFIIRYLCGICQNYNLCQDCEKKEGEKHGHPLLKIRNQKLAPITFSYKLYDKNKNNQ